MDLSETPPSRVLTSWLPDLTRVSLAELTSLDQTTLGPAIASMLSRVERPLATIAGSNGS
ncbi:MULTISPECIES: hypothetical protein [Streptacidiphilus]|uniref:FXSXX-COOH protein n=2 Tax=Streptacidiphilus TaxID=228398 RepID=A0ABV6UFL8_9ACTN|nr:hypothetical protein [Streptacidiphilus jeojiense]